MKNSSVDTFPRSSAFNNIDSLSTTKNSLTFHLQNSDATFISNLVIGILPQDQDFSSAIHISKKVVGCGPYKIKEKTLNEIVLVKNKFYPNKSVDNKIVIRHVKEESTRFAKLLKGELDIVQNSISPENMKSLRDYPNLVSLHTSGLKTSYLGFNFRDKILRNLKVRQALAMAIDKDAIVQKIMHNMADKATNLLPKSHPYFEKVDKWTFDQKSAAQLLDDAGFKLNPMGKRFDLNLKLSYTPTRMRQLQRLYKKNLRSLGINLSITSLEE